MLTKSYFSLKISTLDPTFLVPQSGHYDYYARNNGPNIHLGELEGKTPTSINSFTLLKLGKLYPPFVSKS